MSRAGIWTVLLAAAATTGCAVVTDAASPAASTSAAESSAAASSAPSWTDWDEPDDYRFSIESSCGERNFLGGYRAMVRDGVVVAADRADPLTGLIVALAPDELDEVLTLRDMLDEALRAIGDPEAGDIEVVTDPEDGHPMSVSVDHIELGTDDESCYVVRDYEPGG